MRDLNDKELLLVSGGTQLLSTKTLATTTVVATAQSGGSLSGINGTIAGLAPVPISVVGGRTVPLNPLPNSEMTPMEIFDYLQGQGWSVTGALSETFSIALGDAAVAATAGTAVGTGLSDLIQTYAPGFEQALGGTEANMLSDINAALTDFSNGQIINGLNALFAGSDPYTNSSQTNLFEEDVWLHFV
jgi:hypothetical protein